VFDVGHENGGETEGIKGQNRSFVKSGRVSARRTNTAAKSVSSGGCCGPGQDGSIGAVVDSAWVLRYLWRAVQRCRASQERMPCRGLPPDQG
jgi:hypothetical protein